MKKYKIDESTARAINQLAREQMINKLLSDIMIDFQICDLEGWDKLEYIREIIEKLPKLKKQ